MEDAVIMGGGWGTRGFGVGWLDDRSSGEVMILNQLSQPPKVFDFCCHFLFVIAVRRQSFQGAIL